MTAIFLVWNTKGLALAADQSASAITKDEDGNEKVLFTTFETKIYQPSGKNFAIAFAGNANINGIPIRGIINQWSKNCADSESLLGYAESFIRWLATTSLLENCKRDYSMSISYLSGLLRYVLNSYLEKIKIDRDTNFEALARSIIGGWESACPPNIYGFAPQKFLERNTNERDADDYIDFVSRFSDFRLDEENQNHFLDLVSNLYDLCFDEVFSQHLDVCESEPGIENVLKQLLTKFFIDYTSNNVQSAKLMFVGYGDSDWIPKCVKVDIPDFDLPLPRLTVQEVTHPFATWHTFLGQTDGMNRFWDPMSPVIKREMTQKLQEQFGNKAYLSKVLGTIDKVIGDHDDDVVGPIRDKVDVLSVEQLAFVAQQMVSLESFKSFINEYLPTVGGKIDCITLTKAN